MCVENIYGYYLREGGKEGEEAVRRIFDAAPPLSFALTLSLLFQLPTPFHARIQVPKAPLTSRLNSMRGLKLV